jgi:hypothetical protein
MLVRRVRRTVHLAKINFGSVALGHHRAGQVIQGRSILGPAGVLRYPSRSLLRAIRLHTFCTTLNRGRSAKPARSLVTELFRPPRPGDTLTFIATCHTVPRKLDIEAYSATLIS